jgi:phospholipid-translocating ATPase
MEKREILLDDSFERKTKILDENVDINENIIIDRVDIGPRKQSCLKNFCFTIFPYCKRVNTTQRKMVYIKDQYMNYTEWSNKIENHKYNLITFIPIVLFNQFKQFGNFFYLIMSVSQFFDQLVVGFLFTYISPLSIVVSISMLKELYDDINRRIQDKNTNSTLITVLNYDEINNSVEKIHKNT